MSKRTRKVGIAGKFGPRYGVRVRKRVRDILTIKNMRHECPNCYHRSVKRVSSGVWQCSHCNVKFTATAYNPTIMRRVEIDRKSGGGV